MNLLTLKRMFVLSLATVIAILPVSTAFAVQPGAVSAPLAPVLGLNAPNVIAGQYVVVLKTQTQEQAADVRANALAQAKTLGAEVQHEYSSALNGFAGKLSAAALTALRKNPNVAYIEADQVVTLNDPVESDAQIVSAVDAEAQPEALTIQPGATWGLDRINQRNLPLNATYSYRTIASAVNVYIIDSGIKINHQEFGGRAQGLYNAFPTQTTLNGHGTHVAATVGGITYGVAKGVKLFSVRVLDTSGSGSYAIVIAGVDKVTKHHQANPGLAVANMSLGGGYFTALNTAVKASIDSGIVYVVAAGNDSANACNYSPASTTAAITVGSTASDDSRSYFSNYGSCVDIFAPGSNITSAWSTSNTATNTISGTSMASPHVAGVAALYLTAHPNVTPIQVRNALVKGSTPGLVTNPGTGSPNKLLFSLVP